MKGGANRRGGDLSGRIRQAAGEPDLGWRILDAIPDAVAVVAPDGRIRWANAVLIALFGAAADADPLGRPVGELAGDPVFRAQVEALLGKSLAGHRATSESWVSLATGRRYLSLTMTRLTRGDADSVLVLALRDVTDDRRARETHELVADSLEMRVRERTADLERQVVERSVAERAVRDSVEAMRRARDELEGHVAERTETLTREIAERRRAEVALRRSQAMLERAQRIARLGSWEYDLAGGQTLWSGEMFRILGLEPGSCPPTRDILLGAIHPADRARVGEAFERTLATGEPCDLTHRIVLPDGGERLVHEQGEMLADASGRPLRMAVTVHDVTDRWRLEQERDNFFDLSIDLLCIGGIDGYFHRLSPSWGPRVGWTTAELTAAPITEFLHPDDMAAARHQWEGLERGRPVMRFECRFRCRNGTYRWLQWTAVPAGATFYAVARDVSGQKEAQEAMRRNHELMDCVTRMQSRFIDATVDPNGLFAATLADVLTLTRSRLGFIAALEENGTAGRLSPLAHSGAFPADYAGRSEGLGMGRFDGLCAAALAGGAPVIANDPANDPRCSGLMTALVPVAAFIGLPLWRGDRLVGVMGLGNRPGGYAAEDAEVLRPVAAACAQVMEGYGNQEARRRAEQALAAKTAELERSNGELEQFAYVASHDLQEPLRVVTGFIQLLKRDYGNQLGPEADEFIDFAVGGARRMQALIEGLLEYSRVGRRGGPMLHVSVADTIEAATGNLAVAIAESGVTIDVADGLPVVLADANELMRLFQNLIGNAVKYRAPDRAPRIAIDARGAGSEWVFSVADNGIGIERRYFDRIFMIFQRLHGRDEYAGTGIGLALCKKIVERHRGRIWVESTPGVGSTFLFSLPFEHDKGRG